MREINTFAQHPLHLLCVRGRGQQHRILEIKSGFDGDFQNARAVGFDNLPHPRGFVQQRVDKAARRVDDCGEVSMPVDNAQTQRPRRG